MNIEYLKLVIPELQKIIEIPEEIEIEGFMYHLDFKFYDNGLRVQYRSNRVKAIFVRFIKTGNPITDLNEGIKVLIDFVNNNKSYTPYDAVKEFGALVNPNGSARIISLNHNLDLNDKQKLKLKELQKKGYGIQLSF